MSLLGPTGAAEVALFAVIFLMGAAIGSFLNVVIFRLPRRESLVYPRSRCLSCGEELGVIDLVPVLSYLGLRGRCRHCRRSYSPRYMLVEAFTGLAAVGALQLFGPTLKAPLLFIVFCCLVVVFFIDLDHYIIPDETVAIIAAVGIVLDLATLLSGGTGSALVFNERLSVGTGYEVLLPKSLVGMAMGAGLFVVIAFVSERVFKRPGMGWGDVKLAGAMGAILGPGYQFFTFFIISVIVGAVVGVICMAFGRCGRRDYIPFGPMLAVAAVLVLYFGSAVTPVVMSRFVIQ
ncbi:MAG: prepilin peptidase [candidate division WS1 bacterium]|nr:prepilin peptidase [candidate division WS1 bacterium]